MRRHLAAFLLLLLAVLASSGAAFAHASLVRSEPADGARLSEPPSVLRLTFNEPVTPLVLRLIAPDGTTTAPVAVAEGITIIVKPDARRRGTHVLSWRVISADGHPVGGTMVFSVGEVSAQPASGPAGDPVVSSALWTAKILIYLALFAGIGGAFFRAWMFESGPRTLDSALVVLIVSGLLVTPLSVGLQGLDALNLPLPALAHVHTWQTGIATGYGLTAIAVVAALFLGMFAVELASKAAGGVAARALSLAALLGGGLALTLSGHASSAAPQMLTRPAVFVHVVCVAFWVGALAPLIASMRARDSGPLARFSRVIPYPLAALVISGGVLAVVQLDRLDALWTTPYGFVLSGKIVLVSTLLALAAVNRYVHRPRLPADGASRSLLRAVLLELGIVVAIFALVAAWRFTPPPRSLAAMAPFEIHLHGARAMAHVSLRPVRGRDPQVTIDVLDGTFNALTVKEVTVVLSNPAAGIESLRRDAVRFSDAHWRVAGVRVPVAGRWRVQVELLIDDFEKIVLDDEVELPRLP